MTNSNSPKLTIAVIPRERFSLIERCIEFIYACTDVPFELIVIDPNSPKQVSERLKKWETKNSNCRVIRTNRYVYPYEAKDIAVEHLSPDTEWVVFVDNEVKVSPGWMSWLLDAAKQTGARVLHPLYFIEQANNDISIHMADGIIKTQERNEKTVMQPIMNFVGLSVSNARNFVRKESDFIEFHTFMVHRDILKMMGKFEPLTLAEDVNFSFRLREKGEKIVFEPRSIITYVAGPPFEKYDLPYFNFRWSAEKANESVRYLKGRWSAPDAYWQGKLTWAAFHRSRTSPFFQLKRTWNQLVSPVFDLAARALRKGFRILSLNKGVS